MKKCYPTILNKQFITLKILDNQTIIKAIKDTVHNNMTISMIVGDVANRLLSLDYIKDRNDCSYNFKKALMIRIKLVVDAMKFEFKVSKEVNTSKDGTMYIVSHKVITNKTDAPIVSRALSRDVNRFEDFITLKGSKKILSNNSTEVLTSKATKEFRVKERDEDLVYLYATLKYEESKHKVEESKDSYYKRLMRTAEETVDYMGYKYHNYRKLDSNSRNYPLSYYGFAYEYGDAFQKHLIELTDTYIVTKEDSKLALEYLNDEYGDDSHIEAIRALMANLELLEQYKLGVDVSFDITSKELGEYCHILDVYHNIVNNVGNETNQYISSDFTNSGTIIASNAFGDEQWLKVANLLGGKKQDTHQLIADFLKIPRNDAKKVMQAPNHGGTVPEEIEDMVVTVFGENYKYIRMIAEYGIKLAKAGVTKVEILRPDGVKAIWSPYTVDCKVPLEDGSTVDAIMPFNYSASGEHKAVGLAVSLIHSSDSYVEHYIDSRLMHKGINIKSTLDNFYHRPSDKQLIIDLAYESLDKLRGVTEQQLLSIEQQTGISRGWKLPTVTIPNVKTKNIF